MPAGRVLLVPAGGVLLVPAAGVLLVPAGGIIHVLHVHHVLPQLLQPSCGGPT